MSRGLLFVSAIAALVVAGPALADPCTAPLPERAGDVFAGRVRYVGDGDGLCLGPSDDPRTWIEVRLADFDAPELNAPGGWEARERLRRLVLGRNLQCIATRGRNGRVRVYDRVLARCRLGDRPLGAVLRAKGGVEGGR